MALNVRQLMQNPQARMRLQQWFGRQPAIFRRGPNRVVTDFLDGRYNGTADDVALQARFDKLFARLRPEQRRGVIARTLEVTSGAEPLAEVLSITERSSVASTVGAMVRDSRGDEIEVDFNASVYRRRVSVRADDLLSTDDDGLYRFDTPGGTAVLYNPERDAILNAKGYEDIMMTEGDSAQAAFGGRLSERVVVRALMLGEIFPQHGGVTMLSNVKVRGHADFERGQAYGGYLIPARPKGDWVALGDLMTVQDINRRPVTSNADPMAQLWGAALGGKEFKDELFAMDEQSSAGRTMQPKAMRRAVREMSELFYGLRSLGAVIDPLQVHLDAATGRIWVSPDVEVNLLDITMFTDGEGGIYSLSSTDGIDQYSPDAAFIPSSTLRSVGNDELFFTIKDILWPQLDDEGREAVRKEPARYITRYLFDHMGAEEASDAVHAALDPAKPHEMAELLSFYDHLAGYIVSELQKRANVSSSSTHEASVDEAWQSMRNALRRSVIPQRVLNDDKLLRIYEQGRRTLQDLIDTPRNQLRWKTLLNAYLEKHGTRQLSMFVSMVLPYLAYRNAETPLNTFNEAYLFIARNFNSRADVLRWSMLVEQVTPNPEPSGTDEPGGESEVVASGATVHSLFDFRPTDPSSAAQVVQPLTAVDDVK